MGALCGAYLCCREPCCGRCKAVRAAELPNSEEISQIFLMEQNCSFVFIKEKFHLTDGASVLLAKSSARLYFVKAKCCRMVDGTQLSEAFNWLSGAH